MKSSRAVTLSRRDFMVALGFGCFGAGLALKTDWASAQIPMKISLFPTVGKIRVKSVKFPSPPTPGTVGVAQDNGVCKLRLDGVHFTAEVELEALPGTKPSYFGFLALVQNVNFHHHRTPPDVPSGSSKLHSQCADSHQPWELDGQYPYNKIVVPCRVGMTRISLADAPGIPVEHAHYPSEVTEIKPNGADRFRTYVIWEITDNNQRPTTGNPTKKHVLARVDWGWAGKAGDTAGAAGQCTSQLNPPHAWNSTGSPLQPVTHIGPAAVAATPGTLGGGAPVFSPAANQNIWVLCP